jgi:hypothetical protein
MYWIETDSLLIKQTYMFLKADADSGREYRGHNWAAQVKSILDVHGLSYVWNQQTDVNNIPF